MERFCAFLRGVNVNGTAMIMAEVCQVFSNAGLQDVSSILASGNILFSSDHKKEDLKTMLEKMMSDHFNYDAFLFIKSFDEIQQIATQNPFEPSPEKHVYVFFGTDGVEQILQQEFNLHLPANDEQGCIVDKTFYWNLPKGLTLQSAFGKILGKKSLKDQLTSRNINTVEKILRKL